DVRAGGSLAASRWVPAGLGFAAGAALGFRPSLAPAVALLFLAGPRPHRLAWLGGAAAGVASWLVPLVALTGPRSFAAIATGFLEGHGSSWGGTIASQPDLGGRLHAFAFDLFAANLAWPWPGLGGGARWLVAGCFAFAAVALIRGFRMLGPGGRRLLHVALLTSVPYALWAFVGQNLEKPRHLLPLVPGVALGFAAALRAACSLAAARVGKPSLASARGAAPLLAAGAAALCLLAMALPASIAHGDEPSPGAAFAKGLRATLQPANAMIFTGQEGRLVERYAPEFRAGRIADPAALEPEARRLVDAGVDVFVTSAAPGATRLGESGSVLEIARFRGAAARPGLSSADDIVLYRLVPAGRPTASQSGDDPFDSASLEEAPTSSARLRLAGLPAKGSR
ncbi:MAG TPA: hypothetical protein VGD74_07540, partial [Vulgatibacter sp.]